MNNVVKQVKAAVGSWPRKFCQMSKPLPSSSVGSEAVYSNRRIVGVCRKTLGMNEFLALQAPLHSKHEPRVLTIRGNS